ncbi:uncharacterized protein KRP23_4878 [Phytophthora ramorum]|uniref:uncharacterized protein n=1 Tax=Phytophthora ramorum TaxID=164328 RepID=UPI0030A0BBB8|nr:hypothetical protein KRP23_4878 [Phytophthora ramorum]KAH7504295.1 hypothetical protein KRP22_4789 [Phytophthora ramorum]
MLTALLLLLYVELREALGVSVEPRVARVRGTAVESRVAVEERGSLAGASADQGAMQRSHRVRRGARRSWCVSRVSKWLLCL